MSFIYTEIVKCDCCEGKGLLPAPQGEEPFECQECGGTGTREEESDCPHDDGSDGGCCNICGEALESSVWFGEPEMNSDR
jgi:DnaJ-class molecular chaperone